MTDGLNGFNLRIQRGLSRDMAAAAQRVVGGGWALIQDDAESVPLFRSMGVRTIYRQSGDGDPLRQDPGAFVRTRAEKGADFVHLTNEVVSSPELHAWTEKALKAATAIGVKAVAYNYGTNAAWWQYEAARSNIEYMAKHGHVLGIHVYLSDIQSEIAGAWAWERMLDETGVRTVCTEFNYIRTITDANKGPRGVKSEAELIAFAAQYAARFAARNVPRCWFSLDDWGDEGNGFGIYALPEFLRGLGRLNETYKFKEWDMAIETPAPDELGTPISTRTTTKLRLRSSVDTEANNIIREMAAGDIVTAYRAPLTPSADGEHLMTYLIHAKSGDSGYASTGYEGVDYFNPPVEPVVLLPEGGGLTPAQFARFQQAVAALSALAAEVKPSTSGGAF